MAGFGKAKATRLSLVGLGLLALSFTFGMAASADPVAPAPAAAAAPATAPNPAAAAAPAPAPAPAPAAQQPPPGLSVEQTLYLIRSTLLTLNDANRSGNYTVFRDLAAPDFQASNSAADLAANFTDLRRRKFDLFAVAVLGPQLFSAPAIDGAGLLRISGVFPTRPQQIRFDLAFQQVGGLWRLDGISISTPDAPPPQPVATAAAPAQPRKHR
jgi:hypothetical protein